MFLTWPGSCLANNESKKWPNIRARKCRRADLCFMIELRTRTGGHRLTYSEENWRQACNGRTWKMIKGRWQTSLRVCRRRLREDKQCLTFCCLTPEWVLLICAKQHNAEFLVRCKGNCTFFIVFKCPLLQKPGLFKWSGLYLLHSFGP